MCALSNPQLALVVYCWPRSGCPEDCQTPERQEVLVEVEESPVAYKHKQLDVTKNKKKRDLKSEGTLYEQGVWDNFFLPNVTS